MIQIHLRAKVKSILNMDLVVSGYIALFHILFIAWNEPFCKIVNTLTNKKCFIYISIVTSSWPIISNLPIDCRTMVLMGRNTFFQQNI